MLRAGSEMLAMAAAGGKENWSDATGASQWEQIWG